MTEYIVLSLDESSDYWAQPASTQRATSREQAIRKFAGATGGTYVAIPARSWNPRTVKVETQTRLTLEDPKT